MGRERGEERGGERVESIFLMGQTTVAMKAAKMTTLTRIEIMRRACSPRICIASSFFFFSKDILPIHLAANRKRNF